MSDDPLYKYHPMSSVDQGRDQDPNTMTGFVDLVFFVVDAPIVESMKVGEG